MASASDLPGPKRALVLQHDEEAGAGLLGEWLQRWNFKVGTVLTRDARQLPDPGGFDLVVSLGSDRCASDSLEWISKEQTLLRDAHEARIPVFGICFGAQLLALALGGSVHRNAVSEVGWVQIESRRPDLIGSGPWFEWHFDIFEPPEGAEILALSASGPEAFILGSSLGVQFHPEVDRDIIEAWTTGSRADLDRAEVEIPSLFEGLDRSLELRVNELFDAIGRKIGAI